MNIDLKPGDLAFAYMGRHTVKVVEIVSETATTLTAKLPPGGGWADGTHKVVFMKSSGRGRGGCWQMLVREFDMAAARDIMQEDVYRAAARLLRETSMTPDETIALANLLHEMRAKKA